jgi:hypothetical protein
LTVEARLVAVEYVENAALIGETTEGEGGAGRWAVRGGVVLLDFGLEGFALNRPESSEPPAGDGHGLDQDALGFGLRVVLAGEIGE